MTKSDTKTVVDTQNILAVKIIIQIVLTFSYIFKLIGLSETRRCVIGLVQYDGKFRRTAEPRISRFPFPN